MQRSIMSRCCRMSSVRCRAGVLWATVILVVMFGTTAAGGRTTDCRTLDGAWYNQLGSEMILNHTTTGQLTGEYRTAVERVSGAAGYVHSKVVGASPYNMPGATVGFTVMFKGGQSISAWTGQCVISNGEEVLVSSWLLREQVFTCRDKWKSTRIGQDYFTRTEQTAGPRKTDKTDTPSHTKDKPNINKRSLDANRWSLNTDRRSLDMPCALSGIWYNEMGSELIISHLPNNTITGEYRTAVERSKGAAGASHSRVYGLGNVYSGDSTFALFVVWRGGASVTSWVGQCHVCTKSKNETLQVNWLLRSQIDKYEDNWKATFYGQNMFTRHEQRKGPRRRLGIHTPHQDGEDDSVEADDLHLQQKQACLTCGVTRHTLRAGLLLTTYVVSSWLL